MQTFPRWRGYDPLQLAIASITAGPVPGDEAEDNADLRHKSCAWAVPDLGAIGNSHTR